MAPSPLSCCHRAGLILLNLAAQRVSGYIRVRWIRVGSEKPTVPEHHPRWLWPSVAKRLWDSSGPSDRAHLPCSGLSFLATVCPAHPCSLWLHRHPIAFDFRAGKWFLISYSSGYPERVAGSLLSGGAEHPEALAQLKGHETFNSYCFWLRSPH